MRQDLEAWEQCSIEVALFDELLAVVQHPVTVAIASSSSVLVCAVDESFVLAELRRLRSFNPVDGAILLLPAIVVVVSPVSLPSVPF